MIKERFEKREQILNESIDVIANSKYANKLVLQGGNCLHYFYNSPRYSLDLDFVMNKNHKKGLTSLEDLGKDIAKGKNLTERTKLRDRFLRTKLYDPSGISISIEVYDTDSFSPTEKNHAGGKLLIEEPGEIVLDKITATLDRVKNRGSFKNSDIFDMHFILENYKDINSSKTDIVRKGKEYNSNYSKDDLERTIEMIKSQDLTTFEQELQDYLTPNTNINGKQILEKVINEFNRIYSLF